MSPDARLLRGFHRSGVRAGRRRVLAVVLHGWGKSASTMSHVKAAAEDAFRDKAALDTLVPDLPHRRIWSCARAAVTVVSLLDVVSHLDETQGPYDEIVLIGHSLGATLVRRLFLTAVGPLGCDQFQTEEVFASRAACPWAKRVSRIVLISAFNRGWQISQRLSWYYAILFNMVGFAGFVLKAISRKTDLMPAVFDIRLGAPFMAQTRLHWMAYRRHSDKDRSGPLLIQLLGTRDDLISPFDQVDIAVDGLDQDVAADAGQTRHRGRRHVGDPRQRSYFLLKMAFTGHEEAIDFEGPLGRTAGEDARNRARARARRSLFVAALVEPRYQLSCRAVDPDLMSDQVDRPDSRVRRVVFVIHGIRDDGFWTHRIAEEIRTKANDEVVFRAWTPTYGYFAMLPFMLPWIRQRKVEWFMDQYTNARAQFPHAVFDYVGHSNGTYLGARALRDYADCRFRHVYFAGSVVRSDFGWEPLIAAGRVEKVLNAVATRDWVVALLPKSVERWKDLDLGGAGFYGFDNKGKTKDLHQCRFVVGSHDAGILEGHWKAIAEFIVNGTPMTTDLGEPDLFADHRSARLLQWADLQLLVPAIVLICGLLPLILLWLFWSWEAALLFVLYFSIARFIVTRY